MISPRRIGWLIAALAFLAAVAGVLVGRSLAPEHREDADSIHALLHHELDLDAAQQAKIEKLEEQHSIRQRQLEAELKKENARLAEAFVAEHGYGPQVTAEVDEIHRTMGAMQKETLSHIFAMRTVLRPEQARKLDGVVVKALTADGQ
jgi:Spy/CpxP family protein refolding chaperone